MTFTKNWQNQLLLQLKVIWTLRKVFFSNFLEESKRKQKRESSLEETSISVSLEIQQQPRVNSLSIFVNSYQELCIQQVKQVQQLV